ncbi:hypothetical protein KA977_01815 [Candidatus Dependentiae bacterium]|nr:hypothetical protein [Candidatus Dependentiae bacterium]
MKKLVFGASYYTGKEVLEAQQKYYAQYYNTAGETELLTFYDSIRNAADEYSVAFHLATGYKKLELNAEYILNKIDYENNVGIDNLNYRLFYRPDNVSLIDGTATTLKTSINATYAGMNTANPNLGGFTVAQFLGINDATTLAAASALVTASVLDATTKAQLLAGLGAGMATGKTTFGQLRDSVTPKEATNYMAATGNTTKYGYASPLATLKATRKGYYVMARYLLSSKVYPYVYYESADPGDNDVFPPVKLWVFGINYKPVPVVTFKTEYSIQKFKKEGITTGYTGTAATIASTRCEDFDYFQVSVSYAF